MTRPPVGDEPKRRGRPLAMVCGLLLAVLALFVAPATLRLVCMEWNRGEGHVVSTGERYRTTSRSDLFGMERLRALRQRNRIAGARAPVWYLPKQAVVNLLMAAGSILLIRRGVGPKPAGGGGPP